MKILVTGGIGKVGQWVVRELLNNPAHEVTVFDRVSGAERGAGVEFLALQNRERSARDPKQPRDKSRRQALTDYCQVLFGLNEFIYVD